MFKEKTGEIKGKEENKASLLKIGIEFLIKKKPDIAREYFKKGGLKEDDVEILVEALEAKAARQAPEREKRKSAGLDSKDKEKLSILGVDSIERDPYFAGLCLKTAGYSEEQIRPLFELAKNAKAENEKEPAELDETSKLRLKDLGLGSLSRNQTDFAKVCFRASKLPEKEIHSLLELNLLGIEKEQEKIKEELEKMKAEK